MYAPSLHHRSFDLQQMDLITEKKKLSKLREQVIIWYSFSTNIFTAQTLYQRLKEQLEYKDCKSQKDQKSSVSLHLLEIIRKLHFSGNLFIKPH